MPRTMVSCENGGLELPMRIPTRIPILKETNTYFIFVIVIYYLLCW
jgi:hypothetical protein